MRRRRAYCSRPRARRRTPLSRPMARHLPTPSLQTHTRIFSRPCSHPRAQAHALIQAHGATLTRSLAACAGAHLLPPMFTPSRVGARADPGLRRDTQRRARRFAAGGWVFTRAAVAVFDTALRPSTPIDPRVAATNLQYISSQSGHARQCQPNQRGTSAAVHLRQSPGHLLHRPPCALRTAWGGTE